MSRALERLPRRWLGARIDPGKARIVTLLLLFQRRNGLMAIDAWEAAARGDPAGVAVLSLAYDVFVPRSFTWGDFLAKAFSVDLDVERHYRASLDPPAAVLGSPLSLLFFAGGPSWPPTTVADELRHLRTCEVESLLVSGALDIAIAGPRQGGCWHGRRCCARRHTWRAHASLSRAELNLRRRRPPRSRGPSVLCRLASFTGSSVVGCPAGPA
jgi:hypothetical protein